MDETKMIEDSANSKTNAYVFHCGPIDQRRFYASCLNIINEVGNSKLEPLYGDCFDAIKKRTCPAVAMRKEETTAGRAIYFSEKQMVEMLNPVTSEDAKDARDTKAGRRKVAPIRVATAVEVPAPKRDNSILSDAPVSGGFAEAINEAMKKSAEVPAAQPVPQPKPQPKPQPQTHVKAMPGESLLDIARRKLAERTVKEVSH